MDFHKNVFGTKQIIKKDRLASIKDKKGFIFIFNGWGPGDHIDLWDGVKFRAGLISWLDKGEEL